VVEGVDRTVWRDLKIKARPGRQVADGELHVFAVGVPEEQNLVCPAQPPGQFSSRGAHALDR
jgi:hypothetical protein